MTQYRSHPTDPNDKPSRHLSKLWLALPLLFFVFAMFAMRPNWQVSTLQDSPALGKPAPQIDLVGLTEEPAADRCDSIPDGKVTLLHFWGTWCGPCKMEYPDLSKMANRLESNPEFRFLPVSCEGGRDETFDGLRRKTHQYFASEGITSLAFCDPQGLTRRSAAERLEHDSMFYPTSIVIGKDGRISGVWEGYAKEGVNQMEAMINMLTQPET